MEEQVFHPLPDELKQSVAKLQVLQEKPPIVIENKLKGDVWNNDPRYTDAICVTRREKWEPWLMATENIPQQARNAAGRMYWMYSPVEFHNVYVWVPDESLPDDYRYFCHGLSLGTYDLSTKSGYSVNMDSMPFVLNDFTLYARIVLEAGLSIPVQPAGVARQGDIVAWWERGAADDQGLATINCKHSAKVLKFATPNNVLDGNTLLQTKNGVFPLTVMKLADVRAKYGARAIEGLYRPQPLDQPIDKPPNAMNNSVFVAFVVGRLVAAGF